MVTTFSARLLNLAHICNPILPGRKRRYGESSIVKHPQEDDGKAAAAAATTTNRSSRVYTHAHTRPQDASHAPGPKRRRPNPELQYTAATIRTALADAGRPPPPPPSRGRERALPPGSVDMGGAVVLTAGEYEAATARGGREERVGLPAGEEVRDGEPGEGRGDLGDDGGLSSMHMLAGLIRTTRHCYGFSSDDDGRGGATASGGSPPRAREPPNAAVRGDEGGRAGATTDEREERNAPSEDGSEGLSSWSPSTSGTGLDDDGKKDIDDDNRSDSSSECSFASKGLGGGEGGPLVIAG